MIAKEVDITVKNNLPKYVASFSPRQMKGLMDSIGLRLERAFKDRIDEGDPSWAPLSEDWAEYKGHYNPWYHTTRLESSIEYVIEDGLEIHAGILEHEAYPEGETVARVAAMLEYGTTNIPARPLFNPVFDEQVDKIVKEATTDIRKRIKAGAL